MIYNFLTFASDVKTLWIQLERYMRMHYIHVPVTKILIAIVNTAYLFQCWWEMGTVSSITIMLLSVRIKLGSVWSTLTETERASISSSLNDKNIKL